LHIGLIDEEDWASKWLPFFQPLKIGSVWIRPSTKSVRLSESEQEIILDPGQAFGTGHHESTQLCLESMLLLRPFLEDGTPILDLGTGSGILAMFAAKIGFRNVVALDVDESLESTEERFGLILANLSASLLQNLAEELRLHLDKDGWLVAGGFLSGETNTFVR
jgi:ribosomal protein L11 methyltransferase